ncbi:hypothetical protein MTR67_030489 [Solanum verrucosum]|uniref:Uncharacterized protein n=1 Tax=Solanum verrucosum TaxID=315347 RepID=A0AAF0TYE9_SOLVR|nr:hypothetical protein MTR67_030489 [Solanum verrucosum]
MTCTIEEQLASLTKAIEDLTKCADEQDTKLSKLTNKMDNMIERRLSRESLKLPRIRDERESCIKQTKIKEIHLPTGGLIPIDQLKDFIIEAIEDKSESSSKFSSTYANPYTQRIDNLKMSEGYQPPKLQQFDGKGNSKQHIAHFNLSRLAMMLGHIVIISLKSLFDPSKKMPLIGTHISNLIL